MPTPNPNDFQDDAWVVVRVEASVRVPRGTRIGLAANGEGCRLILPGGREASPVLGFDEDGSAYVTDHDLQARFGLSVDDYRDPEGGAVSNGRGVPREDEDDEEVRFQRLRAWRLSRARAEGLSPFLVVYDRTLRAIAKHNPKSLEELAAISGFSPAKLDKYGSEILTALHEH